MSTAEQASNAENQDRVTEEQSRVTDDQDRVTHDQGIGVTDDYRGRGVTDDLGSQIVWTSVPQHASEFGMASNGNVS